MPGLCSNIILREKMKALSTASASLIHNPLITSTDLDVVSTLLYESKDAMSSRQPSLKTSLPNVKTSSAKEDASIETDSGYASKASTPQKDQGPFHVDLEQSRRKHFSRKVTKLKLFDEQIPQSVQNRFDDLNELFSKPLYDFLSKARVGFSAISIKLKVLGESEATAKPWIIVQCDSAVCRKVKQFFEQKQVKSQYQSSDFDLGLPSFEIVYHSRPPKEIAATDVVYGDAWGNATTWPTLCGKIIKIGEPEDTRTATLGGVIKVVTLEEDVMLYGMTVSHIVAQDRRGDDNGEGSDGEESEGEEETFELDLNPVEYQPPHVGKCARSWSKIGHVSQASGPNRRDRRNLDWALVRIDDASCYRPNLLIDSACESDWIKNQLKGPSSEVTANGTDEFVAVMSGTSGMKLGKLSPSFSFLMLAPGQSLTQTRELALFDGSGKKSIISQQMSKTLTFI